MHPVIDTFHNKSTTFISAVISNQEISCSLSKGSTTRVQRDRSGEGTLRLDFSTKVLFRRKKSLFTCSQKVACLKNINQSLNVWTNNWRSIHDIFSFPVNLLVKHQLGLQDLMFQQSTDASTRSSHSRGCFWRTSGDTSSRLSDTKPGVFSGEVGRSPPDRNTCFPNPNRARAEIEISS